MRHGPTFTCRPSSKVQTCRSPLNSVCAAPRRTVQANPPTRSRASRMRKSYPSLPSSYPTTRPDTPAPRTSTLAPRGRPVSAGRTPACPAMTSHDVIAVMMSDEPPTTPSCSRNRRRVKTGSEGVVCVMPDLLALTACEMRSITWNRAGREPRGHESEVNHEGHEGREGHACTLRTGTKNTTCFVFFVPLRTAYGITTEADDSVFCDAS